MARDFRVMAPPKDPAERKRPRRFTTATPEVDMVDSGSDLEPIESDGDATSALGDDGEDSDTVDVAATRFELESKLADDTTRYKRRRTELLQLRRAVDEMQTQVEIASAQIAELHALVATLAQHQHVTTREAGGVLWSRRARAYV